MDIQRIRSLYDQGKADGQIGRSVGLHHVVIRHWREGCGLPANTTPRPAARISSSPWTEQRDNTAKAMWSDGHSASEIAKALAIGVSRSAVIGRLNRLGVAGKLKARKTHVRSSNRPAPFSSAPDPSRTPDAANAARGHHAGAGLVQRPRKPPLPRHYG